MLRWAEVYLDRLKRNYENLKRFTGHKRIIAVVKANAYGHGSVKVASFLERKTDVDAFAVATVFEGIELREGGVEKPIIVMSNPLFENARNFLEYRLTPVIFDFESLGIALETGIPFHIKLDTGMGRLGFLPGDFQRLTEIFKSPLFKGIMSHFPVSDEDKCFTKEQFSFFLRFIKEVLKVNRNVAVHIDNSAAVPYHFDSLLTHSRIGLALYGSKPSSNFPVKLEQVMEIKSRLIQVKTLPEGWGISYGRTYVTSSREKVGVVAFGYADGLMRSLSGNWSVKINGRKCSVRGRICMDMTIVSLEGVKASPGDEVIITDRELTFDKMAEKAGTISYEIMCDVSPRVKRIFIE
ncbi:alanine racemase [Desulfurobacterium indicum]|uniref:Alanine racemase n=1 Tax=Desulfurobacterium indicum TaxID=1914305 RepID=A0A1R1MNJ1_9BACT|nr:alanine racemase [Desulfurobacterium indicum]OMH41391.1 alanine racemase [Desulfurobacterium indicum]